MMIGSPDLFEEIKNYLNRLNAGPETFSDKMFGRQFIFLPRNKIFLNVNYPEKNDGTENLEISAFYSAKGFHVVHIWDDLWQLKNKVIKSRLRAITGKASTIYGRETTVSRITNPVLVDFLNNNHLNVPLKGKIKYGLFFRNDLVGVISFSHPRTFRQENRKIRSYEILRFCNINDHVVIGGLTKLLNFFNREIKPDHLMTYVDREWGTGSGFEKAGFKETGFLPPQRFLLDKSSYKRYFESEIQQESRPDFLGIWNCGSIKLEKNLSH